MRNSGLFRNDHDFTNSIRFADLTLAAWVKKYGWKDQGELIFVGNQDENIKTKNITEKIEFDNLAGLMTNCL